MRNTLMVLTFLAMLAHAAVASATVWTVSEHPHYGFGRGATYQTTLDLATDGFTPGDSVLGALLLLDFSGPGHVKWISVDSDLRHYPAFVSTDFFAFFLQGSTLSDGRVDLTVTAKDRPSRWLDDVSFTLDDIVLTAVGREAETAPVPEPATVICLSIGCFGVAIYGKRRKGGVSA
ncbi:PEP-CTERM sorting domain-containing protein [Geomonas sp. RF6]|uniref:PEP-CTERM sorting domain-containing protein n=1 Tax=Geomonas sp. RF6 TaxID=2897342 RepID=UPI001E4CC411|nr:PEP-CTERM sorting domain-containing protein [Geomonas sp. RF6]UFS70334.1 PEP-CTERM sorting domain-containing protein [Geomonas sp. RF6]